MNPLYLAMMQQQEQQSPPMSGMPASAPPDPLQMMPQQSASPSYTNPFDSGITKAIEGARASIAVSQAQKQEAFSKSLAAFAAALSQPQQQYWGDNPRSAMMRQLGASMAPGMQTYNQVEDQSRQENLGLADYMIKLKSTQNEALRKALKEQMDRQHQADVLAETKRHHGAQEKKQDNLYFLKQQKYEKGSDKQNRMDALIAQGHIPLDSLTLPAQADYEKRALKAMDDVPEIKRNIETLDKMEKLVNDKPHLATSWIHTLGGTEDKEAGFWGTLGRKFANQEDLAAIQELDKLANSLNFAVIQTVPGKTATNMLKEIIRKASVHSRLTPKAFGNISKGLNQKFVQKLEMAQKYKEGLPKRIVVSDDTTGGDMDIEKFITSSLTDSSDDVPAPVASSDSQDQKAILDQQIKNIAAQIAQLKAQGGIAP